jgi:hypothetical protein
MNKLFPLPIYTFLKIAIENGGFSSKGSKNKLKNGNKDISFCLKKFLVILPGLPI